MNIQDHSDHDKRKTLQNIGWYIPGLHLLRGEFSILVAWHLISNELILLDLLHLLEVLDSDGSYMVCNATNLANVRLVMKQYEEE